MRILIFLLAPVVSIGAIYMFGWAAIIGILVLISGAIAWSSKHAPNPPPQMDDSTLSSYGVATTREHNF